MIAAHLASSFKVYVLGFMPGLAYIAGLEGSLYLPRRTQPRVRVPRSSVAIAMDMTTIYPFESPGGWHLIGRTPLWMFDKRREQPVSWRRAIRALRAHRSQDFDRIARDVEADTFDWATLVKRMSAALKVVRPGLFDTLQDLGRIGFMALGMPTAGAMDASASPGQRARRQSCRHGGPGNRRHGAGLAGRGRQRARRVVGPLSPTLIESPARRPSRWSRPHPSPEARPDAAVGMVEGSSTAYLAVAGGFALPAFMGSLSTYARAGVGGFEGRKLAAGDVLPLARDQAPPATTGSSAQPFDYGNGPVRSSGGRRTTISATRAAGPSWSPTTASPRKPIAWASASRARPSSMP